MMAQILSSPKHLPAAWCLSARPGDCAHATTLASDKDIADGLWKDVTMRIFDRRAYADNNAYNNAYNNACFEWCREGQQARK